MSRALPPVLALLMLLTGCKEEEVPTQATQSSSSVEQSAPASPSYESKSYTQPKHTPEEVLSGVSGDAPPFVPREYNWGEVYNTFYDILYDDATNSLVGAGVTADTIGHTDNEWGITRVAFHESEEKANANRYDGAVAYIHIVPTEYYEVFSDSAYSEKIPSIPFGTVDNNRFILTYAVTAPPTDAAVSDIRKKITDYTLSRANGDLPLELVYYFDEPSV